MKRRLFAGIAGVLVFCNAGQVHAQYPPCQLPMLMVEPSSVPTGGSFTATVSNCRPSEAVVFRLGTQSVSTTCNPLTLQATAQLTAPSTPGPVDVVAELAGQTIPDQPSGLRRTPTADLTRTDFVPAQSPTCPSVTESVSVNAQVEVLAPGTTTTTPTTTVSPAPPPALRAAGTSRPPVPAG